MNIKYNIKIINKGEVVMTNTYWASDLHFDVCNYQSVMDFIETIPDGSNFIITGDISSGHKTVVELNKLSRQKANANFYFVLGNHDYYNEYINAMRGYVSDVSSRFLNLNYLPSTEPIEIIIDDRKWCLLGVDGWGDGKAGNFMANPRALRDYQSIHDFQNMDNDLLQNFLGKLGREEEWKLRNKLENSLTIASDNILIATHVPPFEQAHMYGGEIASDRYLPHFVCVQTGVALRQFANLYPNKNIHVICGHTHEGCNVSITDNLHVHVAQCEYGKPSYTDLTQLLNN